MPSKTSLQTFGLFLGLAAIVACGPLLWSIGTGGSDPRAGLAVGQPIPRISGAGWFNSAEPPETDLHGKVLVVNAWFLACPNCHRGMPDLVELHKQYGDNPDVVFIGLTPDPEDDRDEVARFLETYRVTWPNAFGAIETLIGFQAEYFPGYWVVGRDGRVVWNKSSRGSIESAIDSALSARPAAAAVESSTAAVPVPARS